MLSAQNSLHPEALYNLCAGAVAGLRNAGDENISPAVCVASAQPSLWSHCALGSCFESFFNST